MIKLLHTQQHDHVPIGTYESEVNMFRFYVMLVDNTFIVYDVEETHVEDEIDDLCMNDDVTDFIFKRTRW